MLYDQIKTSLISESYLARFFPKTKCVNCASRLFKDSKIKDLTQF